jgi:hypothetical protein
MEKLLDVLPTVIMIESFLASFFLIFGGRWGSALYWFAAGLINAAVIFGVRQYG